MIESGYASLRVMEFMSRRASSENLNLVFIYSSNEFGTPYLRAMYQYAFDHFQSDFYGYVNADILLDSTVIASLRSLKQDMDAGVLGDRIYAVGQRTNVQQELEDKFVKGGEVNADDFVIQTLMKGHRYWDSAVVGFLMKSGADDGCRITISSHAMRLTGTRCLIL